MNIKISVLKMFITVVEAGNIIDAAEKIGRSPSAVSTALKQLEEEIGGNLFESDRKSHLTSLGQYLYETSLIQVESYQKALHNVHAFASGALGKVQIATVPSIATHILPSVLKKFIDKWPDVEIELRDTDSETIARWVEQGKINFGIGGKPDITTVKFDPIYNDELVLIYPLSTALSMGKTPINLENLNQYSVITNGIISNSNDPILQNFHQKAQLNVHNTASLLALVREGVGITILPKLSVPQNTIGIGTRKLMLENNKREIGIISNISKSTLPVATLMADFFKSTLVTKFPKI